MSRFRELKIKNLVAETPNAKVLSFDIPAEYKSEFHYIPGQYVTIDVEIDGKYERRAYSLCSSPLDADLAVGVKKVENGKVSSYINDVAKIGDRIRVMPPMGNFTLSPDPTRKKHYVLIGGGSGITPLMSIIRTVLEQEPSSKLTLFYANRDAQSIMFKAVLDELVEKHADRFEVFHSLDKTDADWVVNKGYLSSEILQTLLKNKLPAAVDFFDYYICGPAALMALSDTALEALKVPKTQINKEFFTAKLESEKKETQVVSATALDTAEVHITVDGEEYDFQYKGEDSLLEAALDNDIDAPYACQVGACCTCRAKVTEGKVVMADRESLSDEEIEEGYVLTCQSKPLTAKVVYSYDD